MMLAGCSEETQMAVVDTYLDVECLAKDICARPDKEDEDPVPAPAECVDPEAVQEDDDAVCYPSKAYECLGRFERTANKPFAKNNKKACL